MSTIDPSIISGNIIKTRVRLARNLAGYPFKIDDVDLARSIIKKVNRAVVKCDTFSLKYASNLSDIKLEALKERHIISQNLIDNRDCGAALINEDESICIMVNEEDVIREQCFMKGLRLKEAYERLDKIDDELAKNLNIAFDKKFGYLTACATNLGTGLRASVMLFLPALTQSKKISALCSEVSRLGLTVRGVYGEGSDAEGCIYQISNEVTLGISEQEILRRVEDTVTEVCIAERDEMEKLFSRNKILTMDRAKKSFGILTNAVVLSYGEFLSHIANVKLGAMLGIIDIESLEKIDDLIVEVRPANVCEKYGKVLSSVDRDLYRAELVRAKLTKLMDLGGR